MEVKSLAMTSVTFVFDYDSLQPRTFFSLQSGAIRVRFHYLKFVKPLSIVFEVPAVQTQWIFRFFVLFFEKFESAVTWIQDDMKAGDPLQSRYLFWKVEYFYFGCLLSFSLNFLQNAAGWCNTTSGQWPTWYIPVRDSGLYGIQQPFGNYLRSTDGSYRRPWWDISSLSTGSGLLSEKILSGKRRLLPSDRSPLSWKAEVPSNLAR